MLVRTRFCQSNDSAHSPLEGWFLLGVSLGAVIRSQLAAVTAAIGWAFLIEGIISLFLGADTVRWMPGFAAQAVVSRGTELLPRWAPPGYSPGMPS